MRIRTGGSRDDRPIISLHFHDVVEMGFCTRGFGTFFVGSKVLPFSEGQMTLIPAGEIHRCQSAPGTRSHWTWFFFDPVRLLVPVFGTTLPFDIQRCRTASFGNVISPDTAPDLVSIIREMTLEANGKRNGYAETLKALLSVFLHRAARQFDHSLAKTNAENAPAPMGQIAPALEHIGKHYADPLTVPQMATLCSMGIRTFQQEFTRLMKQTPHQYLLQTRINVAAASLKNTEMDISSIAYTSGFSTRSAFNRTFRQNSRTSPRDYRKRP